MTEQGIQEWKNRIDKMNQMEMAYMNGMLQSDTLCLTLEMVICLNTFRNDSQVWVA